MMDYLLAGAVLTAVFAWAVITLGIFASSVRAFYDDYSIGIVIIIFCVGLASLVGLFAFLAYAYDHEDHSDHCGPGTEYRESRHYNPSTRSTHTDWWCEAK